MAIVIEGGAVNPATLQAYLDALTLVDLAEHRAAGGLPGLRAAGVRYQREPRGVERWQTSRVLRRTRRGDCEDIAADVAAALQKRGIRARAVAKRTALGYHIVVRLPGGRTIDPCIPLGMKP